MISRSRFYTTALISGCFSFSLILHGSILLHRSGVNTDSISATLPVRASVIKVNILSSLETMKARKIHHLRKSIVKSFSNEKRPLQQKSQAKLIGKLKLTYPKISRLLEEEGVVILDIEVGHNGRATAVWIKESSGYSRLDQYAKKAALKARYSVSNSRENLTGENSILTLEVAFQLSEKNKL